MPLRDSKEKKWKCRFGCGFSDVDVMEVYLHEQAKHLYQKPKPCLAEASGVPVEAHPNSGYLV